MDVIIDVADSFSYGQSERLLLDGLLQINVVLVGDVQRQLELGDLDLQLLLYTLHLGLQLRLGLHYASVQLLDLDAGLLADQFHSASVYLKHYRSLVKMQSWIMLSVSLADYLSGSGISNFLCHLNCLPIYLDHPGI